MQLHSGQLGVIEKKKTNVGDAFWNLLEKLLLAAPEREIARAREQERERGGRGGERESDLCPGQTHLTITSSKTLTEMMIPSHHPGPLIKKYPDRPSLFRSLLSLSGCNR
jgi:hypothetical protein